MNWGRIRNHGKRLFDSQFWRIVARQACFGPVTQDGLPLIGKVPQSQGAHVATGHSVWGILNALATAEALTELIADGVASSTGLASFDPCRLQ
jgi:glycine/D-amino acid oxidase-like deaminating enzyme